MGPLTLKQILIVGAGVGFSYTMYSMLAKAYGALALPITIVVWIPAVIASLFAFVRINDISLFRLLLLTIEGLNKPSTRVWTPRRGITINIRTFVAPKDEKQRTEAKTGTESSQLDELSVILDRPASKDREDPKETNETKEEYITKTLSSDSSESLDSSESFEASRLPVNPARISVSAPLTSLFRDISPHT